MIYLLDSNAFITAARSYYSFDFGNVFWNLRFGCLQYCLIDKYKKYEYITNNNRIKRSRGL